MTQTTHKILVTLTSAFLMLAVLAGVAQVQGQTAATAQPALQTQMRAVELPDPAFVAAVFGSGTEVPMLEAERLGWIAEDVCTQLGKGFTYMSIRAGLVEVYGFGPGEAGLLMSAAERHVCA